MATTVWRGFITFGLISIPVRLFRAARAERVSLRRLYREEPSYGAERRRQMGEEARDTEAFGASLRQHEPRIKALGRSEAPSDGEILAPVQQASVRKGTDEILSRDSVVKGFEYEKNRFVAVEPEELKSLAPRTTTEMEIQEFVQLVEIDPVYFETSYYVRPEEAGEKAYALLYRSMQLSGLVAIAKFAMHGREHIVVLRPGKTGIISHTMYFASEVRGEEEYRADTSLVSQKELDLAQTLIHSLGAPFEPDKYSDTYREKLESLIAGKVKGKPVTPIEIPRQAEVVDITDALRKSLANLKKPAASEQQPRTVNRKAKPITAKKTRGVGQK